MSSVKLPQIIIAVGGALIITFGAIAITQRDKIAGNNGQVVIPTDGKTNELLLTAINKSFKEIDAATIDTNITGTVVSEEGTFVINADNDFAFTTKDDETNPFLVSTDITLSGYGEEPMNLKADGVFMWPNAYLNLRNAPAILIDLSPFFDQWIRFDITDEESLKDFGIDEAVGDEDLYTEEVFERILTTLNDEELLIGGVVEEVNQNGKIFAKVEGQVSKQGTINFIDKAFKIALDVFEENGEITPAERLEEERDIEAELKEWQEIPEDYFPYVTLLINTETGYIESFKGEVVAVTEDSLYEEETETTTNFTVEIGRINEDITITRPAKSKTLEQVIEEFYALSQQLE